MTSISSISLSCSSAAGCWGLLLILIQSAQAITFPDIKIPSSKQPHELGWKVNWGQLETAIQPLEGFSVTSTAAEAHLAKIRRVFDESKSADGWGIIHEMVWYYGGDNDALLEKLLALGLHMDLEDRWTWRPSHHCGLYARPKSAKAISLCRPNLSAKNNKYDTPLEAARRSSTYNIYLQTSDPNFPEAERAKIRPSVARVWEEVEKNGFPSIAEMASNKQWFAVQNLVRRGVVCRFTEGSVQHQGKTAIEWAVHHRESSLAQELRYYLEPSCFTVALAKEANQTATRFTTMDTKLLQQEQFAKDIQRELKVAQDTSSKREKMLRDEMKEIQRELTLAQDTSSKREITLRDEMKDIQKETEKHQDEVARNITETIISRVESAADDISKLRELLEKIAEHQKELDEDVRKLDSALEKATPPADDNETQMLEQPFDSTSDITTVQFSMAEPTKGPTEYRPGPADDSRGSAVDERSWLQKLLLAHGFEEVRTEKRNNKEE